MLRITTEVDYNDGDYHTNITTITEEKLEELMPLIEAIKNNGRRFGYGDCADPNAEEDYPEHLDLIDKLREYCNYGEFGFHSIDSIKVAPYVEEKELL